VVCQLIDVFNPTPSLFFPLQSTAVKDPLGAFSDPLSALSSSSAPNTASASSKLAMSSLDRKESSSSLASSPLGTLSSSNGITSGSTTTDNDDTFVPWKAKKASILQEFTTDESIGITVSFVEGADTSGKGK
jgi:hypothetical protein